MGDWAQRRVEYEPDQPEAAPQQSGGSVWDVDNQPLMEIPTMEVGDPQEPSSNIAPPPQAVAATITDISTLNKELQKNSIANNPEDGIDLSLLTSVVKPWSQVNEMDEFWDYAKLSIEVAHAIQQDEEELEVDEDFQAGAQAVKEFI